jgi:protein TonB
VPEASAEATLPVQPAPRREPSKFDPSSDSKIAAIAVEEKLRELMGRPPPFIERPSARAVAHSDAERTAARMRQNAALDVEKEHAMAALSAAANRSGVVGGIGDNVETLPRYTGAGLSNAPPHYPFLARRQGQEGRVVLRVQVTAAGEASAVSLRQSSGYRRLDDVAVEAIKKWRFAPASRDGLPVAGSVDVPVTFKLTD